MNKILLCVASAALCLGFFSCSDNVAEFSSNSATGVKTIRTTIANPQGAESDVSPQRTVMTGDASPYTVNWYAGDKVRVNGEESQAVASQYEGTASAEFSFDNTLSAPYKLVYPSSIYDARTQEVNIPVEQKYVEGSFANGFAIMAGMSNTQDMTLNHLSAFIRLQFDHPVDEVIVLAKGGEPLSGSFKVDYANGKLIPLAGPSVVRVVNLPTKAREVIVAVPAGNYSKGFEFRFRQNAKIYKKDAYVSYDLKPGIILKMPKLQIYDLPNFDQMRISSAFDLINIVQQFNAGTVKGTDLEVTLANDIDMKGRTLEQLNNFMDVFDGQGYCIKNWNTDHALINTLSGTVRNLRIDATCQYNYSGTVSDMQHFAFLVNTNTIGNIIGCTNEGNITISSDNAQRIYAAGVVAEQTKGYVQSCTNSGNISVTFTKSSASCSAISGVVARLGDTSMSGEEIVKNCLNLGDITFKFTGDTKAMKKFGIGGVVGQTLTVTNATNDYGTVVGCTNYGTISWEYMAGGTGSYPGLGGVAGIIEGNIKDCNNYGLVQYHGGRTTAATDANIGGVCGYVTCNASNCHNYGTFDIDGAFAGGTQNAQSGGNTDMSSFGGVFGDAGPFAYDIDTEYKIENCSNESDIFLQPGMVSSGGPCFLIGGVVGAATAQVNNCQNNGTISIKSSAKTCNFGGIVGRLYARMSQCINNGNIILDGDVDRHPTAISYQQEYVGGIVGCIIQNGNSIANCINNGDVSLKNVFSTPGSYSCLGGILGNYSGTSFTVEDCINNGNITNTANTVLRLGGLFGALNGTATSCINNGDVTCPTALYFSGKECEIGSLGGYASATISKCTTNGNVSSQVEGSFASAFVGATDGSFTWTGNTVSATLTNTGTDGITASVLGRFSTSDTKEVVWKSGTIADNLKSLSLCGDLKGNTLSEK